MKRFTWFPAAAAVTVVLAQAAMAATININVPNFSFESPALAVDGYENIAFAPSWSSNDNDIYVMREAGIAPGIANGVEGLNHAFLEPFAGPAEGQNLYQVLSNTLQVGTYTLTVAAGHSTFPGYNNYPTDATFGLSSYNGAVYSALQFSTVIGTDLPTGKLSDITMTLNVLAGNPHLGEQVVVNFGSPLVDNGYPNNLCYDNVRLDYVPEPATGLLVLLGLAGVLKRRR